MPRRFPSPRVLVLGIVFVLLFFASPAFPQAGDSPVEFVPYCKPWPACANYFLIAAYPQVPAVSVVQGSATVSATPGNPWTVNESISGRVTLQVLGGFLNYSFPSSLFADPRSFVLTIRNTSPLPWTAFELELQSVLGQPSGGDGLSFDGGGGIFSPPPPTSSNFARVESENQVRDALLFRGGIVNPGETVTFNFFITQRNLRVTSFYIVQRPLFGRQGAREPVGGPTDYLTFSQNPLPFTIDKPGFTAGPVAVTVSPSIGSLSIPFVNTSNGMNWLTATVSGGNTLSVSIVDTGALAMAAPYSGTVTVRANDDPSTDSVLTVTLRAGSCSGLVANPPSWSHIGIGFAEQTFYVTNKDGFIVPVFGGLYPPEFDLVPDPRVVNNPDGTVTVRIDQPSGFSGNLVLFNSFCNSEVQVPINVTQ
jgi:hypothetical protein